MKKNTIKQQVINSVSNEVIKLQLTGVEYLRFKDLEFETDDYYFSGCSIYSGLDFYEQRIAWDYLRNNFNYDKYRVAGQNGNSKFFEISYAKNKFVPSSFVELFTSLIEEQQSVLIQYYKDLNPSQKNVFFKYNDYSNIWIDGFNEDIFKEFIGEIKEGLV